MDRWRSEKGEGKRERGRWGGGGGGETDRQTETHREIYVCVIGLAGSIVL